MWIIYQKIGKVSKKNIFSIILPTIQYSNTVNRQTLITEQIRTRVHSIYIPGTTDTNTTTV